MFRLTDDEMEKANLWGGQQYMVAVQSSVNIPSLDTCCKRAIVTAQVKKIADKIEGMANDGDSVGEILKALREET